MSKKTGYTIDELLKLLNQAKSKLGGSIPVGITCNVERKSETIIHCVEILELNYSGFDGLNFETNLKVK